MDEFPKKVAGWKKVAEERLEVRKLAKKLNVKESHIPELKGMYKIQEFLALHHDKRMNKVYLAKAALLAYEKKQTKFYDYVKGELKLAVKNGWLHESKVGQRLKKMMEAEDPYKYRETVLLPYMEIWERDAKEYDKMHEDMQKGTIPRGLRVLKKDAFLRLSYEQRVCYLHEVKLRMNARPETDPALDAFKKNIRHCLDTQDWDGAREMLMRAQSTYPDDEDLDSMNNFLRQYGGKQEEVDPTQEQEGPNAQKTVEEMRAIVSQLPADLQWLYIEAMKDGPAVFNRLLQLVYNRVWVYEHRYGNEQLDKEHAESEVNKERTRQYIEDGHTRKFERNIVEGDTANEAAIRDECTKPQVLYMGDMGRESVLRKVRTNKDNEGFGYWTTLVPTDVPYATHRNIVKNFNYRLKSGLRTLHNQGYGFSLTGNVQKKSGAAPAPKVTPKTIPKFTLTG